MLFSFILSFLFFSRQRGGGVTSDLVAWINGSVALRHQLQQVYRFSQYHHPGVAAAAATIVSATAATVTLPALTQTCLSQGLVALVTVGDERMLAATPSGATAFRLLCVTPAPASMVVLTGPISLQVCAGVEVQFDWAGMSPPFLRSCSVVAHTPAPLISTVGVVVVAVVVLRLDFLLSCNISRTC